MLSNIVSSLSGQPNATHTLIQNEEAMDQGFYGNLEVDMSGAPSFAAPPLARSSLLDRGSAMLVTNLRWLDRDRSKKVLGGVFLLGLALVFMGGTRTDPTAYFLPSYTKETIRKDPSSPQARALEFLHEHPDFATMPEWRKRQILALRSFWAGLSPEPQNFKHMENYPQECEWHEWPFHGICDADGRYTQLKANLSHTWVQWSMSGERGKGPLPPELSLLTDLQTLWLNDGILTGSVPTELGLMTSLRVLQLHDNGLTGTLPSELGKLTQLNVLNLDHNRLQGTIPSSLAKMGQLTHIQLDDNELTGTIPTLLGSLSHLQNVSLGHNHFSGSIPSELGRPATTTQLLLHDNDLEGQVPSELGQLSELQVLWLNDNEITGMVASEIGQLKMLDKCNIEEGNNIRGHQSSPLLCIGTSVKTE